LQRIYAISGVLGNTATIDPRTVRDATLTFESIRDKKKKKGD
jgi:hypothetical protein